MCSYKEWERLARLIDERVDQRQVREFVAEAASRMQELVDELGCWACQPDDTDWVRSRGRRSWSEWVA